MPIFLEEDRFPLKADASCEMPADDDDELCFVHDRSHYSNLEFGNDDDLVLRANELNYVAETRYESGVAGELNTLCRRECLMYPQFEYDPNTEHYVVTDFEYESEVESNTGYEGEESSSSDDESIGQLDVINEEDETCECFDNSLLREDDFPLVQEQQRVSWEKLRENDRMGHEMPPLPLYSHRFEPERIIIPETSSIGIDPVEAKLQPKLFKSSGRMGLEMPPLPLYSHSFEPKRITMQRTSSIGIDSAEAELRSKLLKSSGIDEKATRETFSVLVAKDEVIHETRSESNEWCQIQNPPNRVRRLVNFFNEKTISYLPPATVNPVLVRLGPAAFNSTKEKENTNDDIDANESTASPDSFETA